MSIKTAFLTVCEQAVPANGMYVSLYLRVPFYGGPEEGGWWGTDTELVAYYHYPSEELAEAALEKIQALADELNKEEKRAWGDRCVREMEWCDDRGVDYDFLPETDGDSEYVVMTEETPGTHTRHACRHYE